MKFVHLEKPDNFVPKLDVVACVCWYEDKLLCLLRNDEKLEGGKWGFPAGKVEKDEPLEQAVKREVYEEVNLVINDPSYKKVFYVRYPQIDYTFHTFEAHFKREPKIVLKKEENQKYKWMSQEEFLSREIVNGNKEVFTNLYG